MPGAQIGLWFKAGNTFQSLDEQLRPADTQGRYEITGLPAGAQFIVYASGKGYGKTQQNVEPDTGTNRQELSPLVLRLANLVIAGQVLKDDDKPAAGVNVFLNGEGQPDGNTTSDSQGRFHFQVCAGTVHLNANSMNGGGFAQASAEAGDTNVVLTLGRNFASAPGVYK